MTVYFAVDESMAKVKIGTSKSPNRRIRQLQTGSGSTLWLYGTIDGGKDEEGDLHRELCRHRIRGEWFDFGKCRSRIDELLGESSRIEANRTYATWEFEMRTGWGMRDLRRIELLANELGVWTNGNVCGDVRCRKTGISALRTMGDRKGRTRVRGHVWLWLVRKGVVGEHSRRINSF